MVLSLMRIKCNFHILSKKFHFTWVKNRISTKISENKFKRCLHALEEGYCYTMFCLLYSEWGFINH